MIKRYEISNPYIASVVEDPLSGDLVLYTDHAAALAKVSDRLEVAVEALEAIKTPGSGPWQPIDIATNRHRYQSPRRTKEHGMIDPKLLTPENGFVEGVVVGVEYFDGVSECGYWPDDDWPKNDSGIKSIRPLTGPMAIWNFAPEWADFLVIEHGNHLWQRGRSEDFFGDASNVTTRPFWARVKP